MGGLIFLLLVLAVIFAWNRARTPNAERRTPSDEGTSQTTQFRFLLSFTLPLWLFYFVMNLWKGTEVNWPAASYFTGMILLAGVVVQQWHSPVAKIQRDWRGWTTATVIWGILLTAGAMNMYRLYPLVTSHLKPLAGTEQYGKSWWNPRKWDLTASKLRGFQSRADMVDAVRSALAKETGQEPLIITGRYDDSSSLAFYMPKHPFVFCIMSNVGGRRSQYDLWPGLGQKDATGAGLLYAGRPAVIVGIDEKNMNKTIRPAFERVEGPERIPVIVDGVILKEVVVYRAWGFRQWPDEKGTIY
jgi:undecaprenyl-diphosphatase